MSRPNRRRPVDAVSILETMRDPALFRRWFTPADSWARWAVFLSALFGLPMTAEAKAIYHEHTRRERAPVDPREAWVVVGRRGGKSLIAALVVVHLACFRDYSKHLAPGERATVLVLASDRRQARVVMRYVLGFLEGVPMLRSLIERQTPRRELAITPVLGPEAGTQAISPMLPRRRPAASSAPPSAACFPCNPSSATRSTRSSSSG